MPKTPNTNSGYQAEETGNRLTEKRLKSHKLLLIICFALVAFADAFTFVSLMVGGFSVQYYIFPLALLLLDVPMLLAVIFSNFRFRYSVVIPALYFVATLAVMGFIVVWYTFLAEKIFMTRLALGAWAGLHALSFVALLVSMLYAGVGSAKRRGLAALFMALLIAGTAGFTLLLCIHGFFGQGNGFDFHTYRARTVVYEYDEEKEYYVATGVLGGRGGYAVIPEEFEGVKVGAVDCGIFADNSLKEVRLEKSAALDFRSEGSLAQLNKNLILSLDREEVDALRETFYQRALTTAASPVSESYLSFVRSMRPVVENDEVYVQFNYTKEALSMADNKPLTTWIAKKGTVFNLSEHPDKPDYVEHAKLESEDDLIWNYEADKSKHIFQALSAKDGTSVNGATINESVVANATFEPIFRITVEDDNDARYDFPQEFRSYKSTGFRYIIKLTADKLLEQLEGRDGFTLHWKYSRSGVVNEPFTSLTNVLTGLTDPEEKITIYPEWELNKPTIKSIGTNSGTTSITYGNSFTLTNTVEGPAKNTDIALAYEWKKGSDNVANSKETTIAKMTPKTEGMYILSVTAGNDEHTALSSTAESSVVIYMSKRVLSITWSDTSGLVYKAADHEISVEPQAGSPVSGDVVKLTLNLQGESSSEQSTYNLRNAGGYTLVAGLIGGPGGSEEYDWKDCYVLANATRSVTIEQCERDISWSDLTVTYDGSEQKPTASAQALTNDSPLEVAVSGGSGWKNAGEYSVTASITNKNYKLKDPTRTFKIEKKEVSFTWEADTAKPYTGIAQGIEVTSVSGAVPGEESAVLTSILHSGAQTNVSSSPYTMRAALPSNSNYKLLGGVEYATQTFTITPVSLTITIDPKTKPYDGQKFSGYTYQVEGLVGNDDMTQVGSITYTGDAVNAVNKGSYTINMQITEGAKYKNYTISIQSATLEITARPVRVSWSNLSLTYNGSEQVPTATATGVNSQAITLIVTASGEHKIVGQYNATASTTDTNYALENTSTQYNITARSLTLNWGTQKEFEENGTPQAPTAIMQGMIEADRSNLNLKYTYYSGNSTTGQSIGKPSTNGNYTVVASLEGSAAGNYVIASTSSSCFFSIKPKEQQTIDPSPAALNEDYSEKGGLQA